MHQGRYIWRFLNLANEVQISPLASKRIHTNVNFFCPQIDKISIGINTQAHDNGPLSIVGANCGILVFTHIDGEIYESTCGHGV